MFTVKLSTEDLKEFIGMLIKDGKYSEQAAAITKLIQETRGKIQITLENNEEAGLSLSVDYDAVCTPMPVIRLIWGFMEAQKARTSKK